MISNNSAHRGTPGRADDHSRNQRRARRSHRGAAPPPGHQTGLYRGQVQLLAAELCSGAASPDREFGVTKVLACTYQAISGAGKTFETWPEMVDNVIPFIGGEEEKSEQEPLKIWGTSGPTARSSRRTALDHHPVHPGAGDRRPPGRGFCLL